MEFDWSAVLLAVGLGTGVPALLLVVLWALARLEAWMLEPDERAAEVHRLLDETAHADDVERAVIALVDEVSGRRSRQRAERGAQPGSGAEASAERARRAAG